MKIKTRIKAGLMGVNHSETLARGWQKEIGAKRAER